MSLLNMTTKRRRSDTYKTIENRLTCCDNTCYEQDECSYFTRTTTYTRCKRRHVYIDYPILFVFILLLYIPVTQAWLHANNNNNNNQAKLYHHSNSNSVINGQNAKTRQDGASTNSREKRTQYRRTRAKSFHLYTSTDDNADLNCKNNSSSNHIDSNEHVVDWEHHHSSTNDQHPASILNSKKIDSKDFWKKELYVGHFTAVRTTMRENRNDNNATSVETEKLLQRMTQLEELVAKQTGEIKKLKEECKNLNEVVGTFSAFLEKLQGIDLDGTEVNNTRTDNSDIDDAYSDARSSSTLSAISTGQTIVEAWEDAGIFAQAPSSILDAADSAGTAILAGLLGGQLRMLVDVRDAELGRDPDTFVQFIELAILPVAAGLEGLRSRRNRLKLVFPSISQLLLYHKSMALAAPEVVALSTLELEPVERQDNLVVIIAPAPDDKDGWKSLHALLNRDPPIQQPVVVMNFYMLPLSGMVSHFEVAYHLRLLTVQYVSSNKQEPEYKPQTEADSDAAFISSSFLTDDNNNDDTPAVNATKAFTKDDDDEFDAAVKHAQQAGNTHGKTRAMVIRSYPQPWHVFVDVSPDTDADFCVAATFDEEPTPDQINHAIVECLEGSEREDEIVTQQMQQALESGQLDRITDMLKAFEDELSDDEDEDSDDDHWDLFREDSV